MKVPFFTVAIPTKNRSFLVSGAIQSILEQSFPDFEILLIDNDDSDKTRQVVKGFSDRRLRYLRTGGLTMPDNWDQAFLQSRGTYTLVLEDKSVLKPWALESIHSALAEKPAEVVSWPQDLFNDLYEPPIVSRGSFSGERKLYSSEEMTASIMRLTRGDLETILPRGLNSCVHRNLVRRVQASPAGRLCPPASPDYTHAYLLCAYADRFLHINDCLTVYGSCKHSHGRKPVMRQVEASNLREEFGLSGEGDTFSLVPLKLSLISVCILNDYESIRRLVGGRLEKFPVNLAHLFVEAYKDLKFSEREGADIKGDEKVWNATLNSQSAEIQAQVRLALEERRVTLTFSDRLKAAGRRVGLGYIVRFYRRVVLRQPPPAGPELLRFSSPLEFVRWDNQQRTKNLPKAA